MTINSSNISINISTTLVAGITGIHPDGSSLVESNEGNVVQYFLSLALERNYRFAERYPYAFGWTLLHRPTDLDCARWLIIEPCTCEDILYLELIGVTIINDPRRCDRLKTLITTGYLDG